MLYPIYLSAPTFLHLTCDAVGVGLCLGSVKPRSLEPLGRLAEPPKCMNWLFLGAVLRLQGKAIDGVSLLALMMKNGSVEYSSSESTAEKKVKKSLFHIISASCITGRRFMAFFLFSYLFMYLTYFPPSFLCYRYTWTAGISRSGLQTGT